MNFKRPENRAGHRWAAVGIIAAVLAAVVLLNIGATFLCESRLLWLDFSSESSYSNYDGDRTVTKYSRLYTLMEETEAYLGLIFDALDESVTTEIIFCNDPDMLVSIESMRPIYYTALNLQKKFPDRIKVSTVNVWQNPSAVDAYRSTSYSSIYQSNVIVASGTEFRVIGAKAFYSYDEDTGNVIAFSGEKQFVKQILAVTRAEAPICCLTVNHGEPFATLDFDRRSGWEEYGEFVTLIEGAGYEVRTIDLAKDEIPENCRLIITLDPQTDFVSSFKEESVEVSESAKLDAFLDAGYSFLVLVDADTPKLPNLEEYLSVTRGVELGRYEDGDGNYRVTDASHSVGNAGVTFYAQYADGGFGYRTFSDLISVGASPKVIFGNAIPLSHTSAYDTVYVTKDSTTGKPYSYGSYSGNRANRDIYDMFRAGTSSAGAVAYAVKDGVLLTDGGLPIGGAGDNGGIFNVMTLTADYRVLSEGKGYTTHDSETVAAFVCVVGSTEFVSDKYLAGTSYGNTDALLSLLRMMGRERLPIDLSLYWIDDQTIGEDYHDEAAARSTAWKMTVIPAVLILALGVCVTVVRKTRHG